MRSLGNRHLVCRGLNSEAEEWECGGKKNQPTGIWKGQLGTQLFVWGRIQKPRPEAWDESEWARAPHVQVVPEAVRGAHGPQAAQTTPGTGGPRPRRRVARNESKKLVRNWRE